MLWQIATYLHGPTWRMMSLAALTLAIVAFMVAITGAASPCAAYAAGGSCSVGDDEVLAGDLGIQANTANTLTQTHAITANRIATWPDLAGTVALTSGAQTFTDKSLTSPTITGAPTAAGATWGNLGSVTTADINGGTVDSVVIGGSAAAAGTFTTLTATTLGGALNVNNENITNIDVDSGAIDGTTIGAASAAAGTFTTLTATTLGGALNVNNENLTNVDINSGAIDGTTIGASVAAAGTFTTGTFSGDVSVNGGDLDLTVPDGQLGHLRLAEGNATGKESFIEGTTTDTNSQGLNLVTNSFGLVTALSLSAGGNATFGGDVNIGDGLTLTFGNSGASDSFIRWDGGNLEISSPGGGARVQVLDPLDLQNNDVFNLGDGGTDITSTGATFGVPTAINDTLSHIASGSTLGSGVTTFSQAGKGNVHQVDCHSAGNTIATITGGVVASIVTFLFIDSDCTITDDNSHATNTIDLSAAFTSADDTVLQLLFHGGAGSWYEISRSVN